MIITDCYWEKRNLGVETVEIGIEKFDVYNKDVFLDLNTKYGYVVVKVPMNKTEFNFGLAEMGFSFVETQLNISKTFKTFPFEDRIIKTVFPHVSGTIIETNQELDEILGKISSDMFSTDRIYIDSKFSHTSSSTRYKNWIESEFSQKKCIVKKMYYDNENVGFAMTKIQGDTQQRVLGGIFEKYQANGLGIMTASFNFITAKKDNKPFKILKTAISSNNTPVLQIYNYLNFKIDKMTYVFVKHNR